MNTTTASKMHTEDEVPGHPVGQFLDRRFAGLRIFDQFDDLRQGSIFANPGSLELECASLVERAADDIVASFLFDRQAFTGQHRFVHGRIAFSYLPIHRDAFARADEDQVADLDFVSGNFLFLTIANHARDLGLELHQFADRF